MPATWLLIGGETLLGTEIAEVVAERKLPVTLKAAAARPDVRILTAKDDELEVVAPLDAASVEEASVLILAGSAAAHTEARRLALASGSAPALIDASGPLELLPEARICAPVLGGALAADRKTIHIPAHPVAVGLARLVRACRPELGLVECVSTIFEPASEHGREGLSELHQQVLELFNFKQLPREIYDAQLAFNLLPRLGEDAPLPLGTVEARIEKHLASLLGPSGLPLPSIRLVQAPVFHGYSLSARLKFEAPADVERIAAALTAADFEVRGADVEPGTNAGLAGQSGLVVSNIERDRQDPRAAWLWLAFDNIRAHAENAVVTAALLSAETHKKGAGER